MSPSASRRQGGLSLVELIVFIVIVSVGVAGILTVFNVAVRGSVDPMVRKQAIAAAESLLLEIEQQAFTWCDPQDTNALTATSSAGCANDAPAGETRYSLANPYDQVGDYSGWTKTGIDDISGSNAIAGYTAVVTITPAGATYGLLADAVLRISVQVSGPGGESVTLVGNRFRYAPNAPT